MGAKSRGNWQVPVSIVNGKVLYESKENSYAVWEKQEEEKQEKKEISNGK